MDNVHLLRTVKNEILDSYLSFGWYRMGHLIFTTHSLEPYEDGRLYPVFWLRYIVSQVRLNKRNQNLIAKNKRFTVSCHPFILTDELDQLHRQYAINVSFTTALNLKDLLKDTNNEVYDSYVVEIRDNGKLIAAGIFDKGIDSIAGIINFYDPAYKKYSPGKFIMLMKYKFCLEHNLTYYYPGYFSPEYPVFDYKLFLDKNATEVFIPGVNTWIRYDQFLEISKSQ